jgi:hypothetical protein
MHKIQVKGAGFTPSRVHSRTLLQLLAAQAQALALYRQNHRSCCHSSTLSSSSHLCSKQPRQAAWHNQTWGAMLLQQL